MRSITQAALFRFAAAAIIVAAIFLLASAQERSQKKDLFDRKNLVAWCIVPFDAKNRGPAERAEMLKRLGFSRVAYDWRANHVASFEEEILAYKKYGIEYFAFWGTHDKAFELFAKHGLHPQIWQTAPSPDGKTNEERVALAVKQLRPLVAAGQMRFSRISRRGRCQATEL